MVLCFSFSMLMLAIWK
uniref:Uncharacterized protein n=1 Tax=Arundo donax TaxID=35708 RepID=A0A0A9F8Q6_ARUDO